MKYYTYFPGCSCSEGTARAYGRSAQAVSKALEVELIELEDWNCCGCMPFKSVDEMASLCLATRDLALAEKRGFDLVTPCSCCYNTLKRTNVTLKQYPQIKAKVDEALAAAGLEYHGTIRVRHLLDIFVNDVGYDAIKARVRRNLGSLKLAAYYGCHIVRPVFGFDHPESPQSLDKLIASLGGEPVPFPLKTRCCGGSLMIPEQALALDLIRKLLDSASSNGAECLVTVCPLCQTNIDAYQNQINRKFKTNFNLPIIFFTQLMGVAFGLSDEVLGLKMSIVPVEKVLAKYL